MPADVAAVRNGEATRTWLASRATYWGHAARGDELVETLAEFCDFVGKSPDEILSECLRPSKDGGAMVLRVRARRSYIEQIERFEAERGRDAANIVRGFLIHNGVAMNPSILL